MFEDKRLIWKLKRGDKAALCQIYEKYKNAMLSLAFALLKDKNIAEDILHDCFVSFAQCAGSLDLRSSLKSYLLTSVANRARNLLREKIKPAANTDDFDAVISNSDMPEHEIIFKEQSQNISINTIQSRYRYGIEKLRTILKEE